MNSPGSAEMTAIWRHSYFIWYSDGEPSWNDCIVTLGDGILRLKYDDESAARGHVVYQGAETAPGNWTLTGDDGGVATLRRDATGRHLEGDWKWNGFTGTWVVKLFDSLPEREDADD